MSGAAVESRGLFGGFEGFRIPDRDTTSKALKTALVSIDANVLLDLYRYSDELTAAMLEALESLGDRLFVSDQALTEFWRNRTSALEDRSRAKTEILKRVAEIQRSLEDCVDAWARKITLDSEELLSTRSLMLRQFEALRERVAAEHNDDTENYPSPAMDPIVSRLEALLDGRVGAHPDEETFAKWVSEGKNRHATQRPPGYKERPEDKAHLPEGVAGDFLVWAQSTNAAAERGLDLLILTRDEKEDWWWRLRSQILGPRHELALEYWKVARKQLFLMTPSTFIQSYSGLGGEVSSAVIDEVNEEAVLPSEKTEAHGRTGTWTSESLTKILELLDLEASVQARCIREAAASGGAISRERIYVIGEYPVDRMLRGFTRPVTRLTRWLQEQGVVEVDAPSLLEPEYDLYGLAVAFRVPHVVVALLADDFKEYSVPDARSSDLSS